MSVFKGPEGGYSSKRLVGLAYAALGIVMVLWGTFTAHEIDIELLMIVVGTALTSLGISSISYFGKSDIVRPNSSVGGGGPKDPKGDG